MQSFEDKLAGYAELALKVGVNLQPGQRLFVMAPLETAPFVRVLAETAYRMGCPLVEHLWYDDQLALGRFRSAPRDSFDQHPTWQVDAQVAEAERGCAFLRVQAADPYLLAGQDPELVEVSFRARQKALQPFQAFIRENRISWCLIAAPVAGWAAAVFPEAAPEKRTALLWQEILSMCRMDTEEPIAEWRSHIRALASRTACLNGKAYAALRLTGPGTDLRVGLPQGHRWIGGQVRTPEGVTFCPNLPTEEVFTLPHRERVEGVVAASRPLFHQGMVFEDFTLTFEQGRVTEVKASNGEEHLRRIVEMDEGASRLGEVALVPESSPVARRKRLFYHTLFDENAACHLALGFGFPDSLERDGQLAPEQFAAAGGNSSQIHIDFMVGSAELDVDGLTGGGDREPLLRQGEWVGAFSG